MVGLCLKPCGKPVHVNGSPCQPKANLSLSVPDTGSLKTVSFMARLVRSDNGLHPSDGEQWQ